MVKRALQIGLTAVAVLYGITPVFSQKAIAVLSAPVVETGDTFGLRVLVAETPLQPRSVDFSPWAGLLPEEQILSKTAWFKVGEQWGQNFTFIAFDSARLELPSLQVVLHSGKKTETNPLKISIHPTLVKGENIDPIRDLHRAPPHWTDYWAWIAGGLVLLLLLWFLMRRKPKPKAVIAPPPPPPVQVPPHQIALQKLYDLEKNHKNLPGGVFAFCAELSFILREYFEHKYRFPALESTTREIAAELKQRAYPEQLLPVATDLLRKTDLAKYGKKLPEENFTQTAIQNARMVIKE